MKKHYCGLMQEQLYDAEIFSAVQSIVAQHVRVHLPEENPSQNIWQIVADSHERVDCIMDIEECFGVDIPDAVVKQVQTVEDLCVVVANHGVDRPIPQ